MDVTKIVARNKMNIAARVIATMSMVVKAEAKIIFMGLNETPSAQESQHNATEVKSITPRLVAKDAQRASKGANSPQTGPIVGHENRIAGIGRIVFHARGLSGNEAFKADLPFESGDVLSRVVGDAGNCVAVRNKMARAIVSERLRARTEDTFTYFGRFRRMFHELDDLTFRDASDLIEV